MVVSNCALHVRAPRLTDALHRMRGMVTLLMVIAWIVPPLAAPPRVEARFLGEGDFSVSASVFGTALDGLIGDETTNGRVIMPFDRMVSLPACTESSCPWLSIFADPADRWGPQTACAESDGLCWVEVTSELTGLCTVAPVLDVGPLFKKDNWWEARQNRTYDLRRGLTAAESAVTGADLGFGAGISDTGLNISRDYPDATSIGLGVGTWLDLGLDPDKRVTGLKVRLLWQDGTDHANGCDGTFGNAKTVDQVILRAGPSTSDEILSVLRTNLRLTITGASANGFYRVDVDGIRGWVSSEWAKPDGGASGSRVGFVTDKVNFRAGPSTEDDIFSLVPEGNVVVVTGAAKRGFLPVKFQGKSGWISADWLDLGDEETGSEGTTDGDLVLNTDHVNFRAGSSLSARIIAVLPVDTEVTRRGTDKNGFSPVIYENTDGWIWSEYLLNPAEGDQMAVQENLNLRSGPSTSDTILAVMPAGGRVSVTGNAVNGFLPVTYDGLDGWAFAQYLK